MLRLRDDQWERIRTCFPEEHIPDSRPGRKPISTRAVLEAVLWILNTGAQWHFLPQCNPNYKTVHRRFQQWCHREVLREVLTQLANTLREEGTIDERESFIDATFAAAKGGELFDTPAQLLAALDRIPSRSATDTFRTPHPLWDGWVTVMFLIVVLCIEWILRKKWNLL